MSFKLLECIYTNKNKDTEDFAYLTKSMYNSCFKDFSKTEKKLNKMFDTLPKLTDNDLGVVIHKDILKRITVISKDMDYFIVKDRIVIIWDDTSSCNQLHIVLKKEQS